jgi:hypothetical protein
MSNGHIDAAELEAMLTGDRRAVDRYLVTAVQQLTTTVEGMAQTCETRGRTCPGVVQAKATRSAARTLVERFGFPAALILTTIGLTKLFG